MGAGEGPVPQGGPVLGLQLQSRRSGCGAPEPGQGAGARGAPAPGLLARFLMGEKG